MSKRKPKVDLDNEYVRKLPEELQEKLYDSDIFACVCEMKMIECKDGIWKSSFSDVSTLAFVCGLCFCGDTVVGWKFFKGERRMPVKLLEELFGVEGLKYGRKNYQNRSISKNCHKIDCQIYRYRHSRKMVVMG